MCTAPSTNIDAKLIDASMLGKMLKASCATPKTASKGTATTHARRADMRWVSPSEGSHLSKVQARQTKDGRPTSEARTCLIAASARGAVSQARRISQLTSILAFTHGNIFPTHTLRGRKKVRRSTRKRMQTSKSWCTQDLCTCICRRLCELQTHTPKIDPLTGKRNHGFASDTFRTVRVSHSF